MLDPFFDLPKTHPILIIAKDGDEAKGFVINPDENLLKNSYQIANHNFTLDIVGNDDFVEKAICRLAPINLPKTNILLSSGHFYARHDKMTLHV